MKKQDILAAVLVEKFGCHACKSQVSEDDFLTGHGRFWCSKKQESFESNDTAHVDCPSWAFNGDKELLESLIIEKQMKFPEEAEQK